jgi:hypothetical protein
MKDVTLEQKSKATNHGGDDVCAVTGNDGNGMDLTSLLYWDVSSIAEGSTITGATIKLWVKDPSINTYQIYECKKPWLESQATWLGPDSKANWGHQGAHGSSDRGEPISQLYAKEIGYASIFLDPKLVQAWVDGSKQNHGLIIASGTAKDKITFSCSESNRQSHRPALEITFERS